MATRPILGDVGNIERPLKGVKRNAFTQLNAGPIKKPKRSVSPSAPRLALPPLPPQRPLTTRETASYAYYDYMASGAGMRALRASSSARLRPQPDSYHASAVRGRTLGLAYSHDAKRGGRPIIASGTVDGQVGIWSSERRLPHDPLPSTYTYRPHTNMIRDLCWSRDDTILASAGADCFARISNAATGQVLHEFPHSFSLHAVSFDPHNDSLLCTVGRDKRVCIWDVRAPALSERQATVTICPSSPKTVTSVTSAIYLPNEPHRLVTSWSQDGILKKWDLRFLSSSNAESLASAGQNTLKLPVEVSPIDPTIVGTQRSRGVSHLVFNNRTNMIYALAANGRIHAHNPCLEAFAGNGLDTTYGYGGLSGTKNSFFVRMALSPCGKWLASGSSGCDAHIYALDGRPALPFVQGAVQYQRGVILRKHADEVHGIDWGVDTLAMAADDQLVSIWRHDPEAREKCREDPEAQTWNWHWAVRDDDSMEIV